MFKNRAAAQPKGWRPFHFAMLAGGATLLAIGATACAVDDDMAVIAKKNVVVVETPSVSKAYTYPEKRTARPTAARAHIVAYHGSARYICSPSGFGQKSRCFARPSI
ncbi:MULTISPECIES: hypothetical protein [Rhizobium]|uniref:hypothetical protein n=1 Tax=Rhizobium TaxID=379 RepID=UPI001B3294E3|nr:MULTISPECIES: hypothetical protein [Rhizobium]MBX4910673.1 hypothetical protein [Rhizobium bangladeshense]MBX5218241.1 hypothetical protein [Rhizobium sp. NLR9a]MBX5224269.1 hypothetical protein [Rhizobium sp. NLR8a]MBX5235965.1 hypothetical protein [Rhizobium sp. NLR4a]MBX5248278.1 hypothetical protein [Rhizobium sp. NLR3b]